MAIQEITLRAWQQDMCHLDGDPHLSVASAAKMLKVSKQRVYQLIHVGRLDALYIYDVHGDKPRGNPLLVLVTVASVERFKASKPGEQQPLFVNKNRRRVRLGGRTA